MPYIQKDASAYWKLDQPGAVSLCGVKETGIAWINGKYLMFSIIQQAALIIAVQSPVIMDVAFLCPYLSDTGI